MAKKKTKKTRSSSKKSSKKNHSSKQTIPKEVKKQFPTIDLRDEKEIAMDFAVKAYKKFDKMVKAIALFGSTNKGSATSSSDIDIIIVLDDASILWDQELVAWYREELAKLVAANPYKKELHITSTRITTFWNDMLKGDPVIINVLRYGEALIDIGGFFNPLKALLQQGKIKPTPEAIFNALQRAPEHFRRSQLAELGAIEGLFWAMVDSSQAALMAAKLMPPSYEHIPGMLKEHLVDKKLLKMKYVLWYRDLYVLHRQISHGDITALKGVEIDDWQDRTEDFIGTMAKLVKDIVELEK